MIKLKLPDCSTSGFCTLDYVLAEGLSIHHYSSTLNICGDFFDVFVNRENAFIHQLEANSVIWVEGMVFCSLLDKDDKSIQTYYITVCYPPETLNELFGVSNS